MPMSLLQDGKKRLTFATNKLGDLQSWHSLEVQETRKSAELGSIWTSLKPILLHLLRIWEPAPIFPTPLRNAIAGAAAAIPTWCVAPIGTSHQLSGSMRLTTCGSNPCGGIQWSILLSWPPKTWKTWPTQTWNSSCLHIKHDPCEINKTCLSWGWLELAKFGTECFFVVPGCSVQNSEPSDLRIALFPVGQLAILILGRDWWNDVKCPIEITPNQTQPLRKIKGFMAKSKAYVGKHMPSKQLSSWPNHCESGVTNQLGNLYQTIIWRLGIRVFKKHLQNNQIKTAPETTFSSLLPYCCRWKLTVKGPGNCCVFLPHGISSAVFHIKGLLAR